MSGGHNARLLTQRRFLPLFVTQFLGAFNDNLFKFTLVLLITYQGSQQAEDIGAFSALAGGIFILPFFLFSATFGQMADKWEKTIFVRATKILEIGIMLLASVGFYFNHMTLLLIALFLMGTHSTLFGPVKYSLLPQHLHRDELVAGNGLIEMGTFIAILLGQMLAGILMSEKLLLASCVAMIAVAVLGLITARQVPPAPATDPTLNINWNFFSETWRLLKYSKHNWVVFQAMLGISWFWFYGATILSQLPVYTKVNLGGDETVFTLLLAIFSVGIGAGSILCDRLSQGRIEIGLVPLGSIGLSIFALDWALVGVQAPATLMNISQFMQHDAAVHLLLSMFLIGLFGGFFTVPLYALIQTRSAASHQSRVIAANNVLNALLMVMSALLSGALLKAGLSIPGLIAVVAVMNAVVAVYIYFQVPEFLLRFVAWVLINTVYRLRERGMDHIPKEGACVVVCNHVSFVDAIIIAAAVPRPLRFVMDHQIFKIPLLSALFRTVKAIPIAPSKENGTLKAQAFDAIADALKNGEAVCIFPEGKITFDGQINEFRPGIEEIIARTPVPVVPMALRGLWGSFFSRKNGKAMTGVPWKLWMKVELHAAPAVAPEHVSASDLQQRIAQLRGDCR